MLLDDLCEGLEGRNSDGSSLDSDSDEELRRCRYFVFIDADVSSWRFDFIRHCPSVVYMALSAESLLSALYILAYDSICVIRESVCPESHEVTPRTSPICSSGYDSVPKSASPTKTGVFTRNLRRASYYLGNKYSSKQNRQ